MKNFTDEDVSKNGEFERIYCDRSELIDSPTEWQKMGLQETASGYGRRLNSGLKISFNGKLYRIYTTIFSNLGSSWFKTKGRKIYIN